MEQLHLDIIILQTIVIAFSTIIAWFIFRILLTEIRKHTLESKQALLSEEFAEFLNNYLYDIIDLKQACNIVVKKYHDEFEQSELVNAIVKLHQNFQGEFEDKLSALYTGSGLYMQQHQDITSTDWNKRKDAILVFSEIKYEPAIDLIKECIFDENEDVKHYALLALVNILGWKSVEVLTVYPNKISEWTLIHMGYEFAQLENIHSETVFELMKNKNESIQVLAFRLISRFRLQQIYESIAISMVNPTDIIFNEMQTIEERLGYQNN